MSSLLTTRKLILKVYNMKVVPTDWVPNLLTHGKDREEPDDVIVSQELYLAIRSRLYMSVNSAVALRFFIGDELKIW